MNPIIINIISIVSIIILLFLLGYIIYRKPNKMGFDVAWFVIPIFIVGLALNFVAHLNQYGAENWVYHLLNSLFATISMFSFSIEYDLLYEIVSVNVLFYIAVVFAYIMASLNIIFIVYSLVYNIFRNEILLRKIRKNSHYIVMGNNNEVLSFIEDDLIPIIVIMNNTTENKKIAKSLKYKNVAYILSDDKKKALVKANVNNDCIIISLEDSDEQNLANATIISNQFSNLSNVYINYSHIEYIESLNFNKMHIKFFNKDKIVAQEFLDSHILLDYLDDSFIDTKTASLKKGFSNIFIGNSLINSFIIEGLIFNYQFIDNKVDISIFSKDVKDLERKFNGRYYAFNDLKNINNKEYYDQEKYNDIKFYNVEYDSYEFKDKLFANIRDYNFIYVDYGSDKLNFEISIYLNKYFNDLGITNYKIFTRIKDDKQFVINNPNIVVYGLDKSIYSKHILIDNRLDVFAKKVNYFYAKKYNSNVLSIDEEWDKLSYELKESNRSSSFSIKIKLRLLGLKLVQSNKGLTKEDYLEKYYSNEMIKDLSKYDFTNARINLGLLEHLRWNTFEIYNNIYPLKKKEILNQENSSYNKRISNKRAHANITSLKGMFDLENDIINSSFLSEEVRKKESNIFVKDFDLMDNLYEIIEDSDYKIDLIKE